MACVLAIKDILENYGCDTRSLAFAKNAIEALKTILMMEPEDTMHFNICNTEFVRMIMERTLEAFCCFLRQEINRQLQEPSSCSELRPELSKITRMLVEGNGKNKLFRNWAAYWHCDFKGVKRNLAHINHARNVLNHEPDKLDVDMAISGLEGMRMVLGVFGLPHAAFDKKLLTLKHIRSLVEPNSSELLVV